MTMPSAPLTPAVASTSSTNQAAAMDSVSGMTKKVMPANAQGSEMWKRRSPTRWLCQQLMNCTAVATP